MHNYSLIVYWGLTLLLNIRSYRDGACLQQWTNVLPNRNVNTADTEHDTPLSHTIQTQNMTPHHVTLYRHRAHLSLCYPLMCNVTLEYPTPILMSWVTSDREILTRPSTHQWMLNLMMLIRWKSVRRSLGSVPY